MKKFNEAFKYLGEPSTKEKILDEPYRAQHLKKMARLS
jgi:hypothetical protein